MEAMSDDEAEAIQMALKSEHILLHHFKPVPLCPFCNPPAPTADQPF